LQGIKANKKEAGITASNLFNKLMYGTDNPTAFANTGTEETVENITLDDVKTFYANHYSPKIASIIAVSDLNESAMKNTSLTNQTRRRVKFALVNVRYPMTRRAITTKPMS